MFLLEPMLTKTWHESFLHTKKKEYADSVSCSLRQTLKVWLIIGNTLLQHCRPKKKINKNNKKIKFDRNRDHSSLKHVFTA